MASMREIVLVELLKQVRKFHPDAVVGWDMNLAPVPPEEAGLIVEVFNLPFDREQEFYKYMFPHVRAANRKLGCGISLITHDPENTQKLYAEVVERLKQKEVATLSNTGRDVRIIVDRIVTGVRKAFLGKWVDTFPPVGIVREI